jgi:hypothetical protein
LIRVPDEARPSSFITGAVVDSEERPIGGATVAVAGRTNYPGTWPTSEEATGRFKVGPVPPGEYMVMISARGFPDWQLADLTVRARETRDLGYVRMLKGGTVAVTLVSEDATLGRLPLRVLRDGHLVTTLWLEDRRGRSPELPPGPHGLQVWGRGFSCEVIPFEVRTGEETKVEVRPRRGVARKVRFEVDDPGATSRWLHVVVRDAAGKTCIDHHASSNGSEPLDYELAYAPGEYTVEATTRSGRRGTASFRVDAEAPGETVVVRVR